MDWITTGDLSFWSFSQAAKIREGRILVVFLGGWDRHVEQSCLCKTEMGSASEEE
jgi:hypothetical protein